MPKSFLLKRNFNDDIFHNHVLTFGMSKENDKSFSPSDNGVRKISEPRRRVRGKRTSSLEMAKSRIPIKCSYPSEIKGEFLVKQANKDIEDARDEVINYERYASLGKAESYTYRSFSGEQKGLKAQLKGISNHMKVCFDADPQQNWNTNARPSDRMSAKFLSRNGKNEQKGTDHEKKSRKKEKLDGIVYRCNQCGKIFKTRYTLSIHLKMPDHTQNRPFVCNICGKGFRLSSTLCRHKIIHTDKKPHKCPSCNKSFNRSSTLKTHMRTHSEEKSFVCDTCGKGFHQKGNLRNHVMIHTGEKPFKCSKCDRAFNKMSNLKFHMHTHSGNLPYQCKKCKKRFTKKTDLKQHSEDYH